MERKTLTWHDIESMVQSLDAQIKSSDWQPHVIVGLSRGGLIPAALLSYKLGVANVISIPVRRDASGNRTPIFSDLSNLKDKRVLVVDDTAISGTLIKAAVELVAPFAGQVRSCALATRGG